MIESDILLSCLTYKFFRIHKLQCRTYNMHGYLIFFYQIFRQKLLNNHFILSTGAIVMALASAVSLVYSGCSLAALRLSKFKVSKFCNMSCCLFGEKNPPKDSGF